jgi:hypothetical protein
MLADLCEGNGAYTAEELTEAIRMLRDILATSGPRVVCMRESEDSVLIFTDGAFEAGVATCGGIMFDQRRRTTKHFGMTLPSHVVEAWTAGSKQPIALVEMLPVLICKELFASSLRDRAALFFIDNNTSLYQVISGSARNFHARRMLIAMSLQDSKLRCRPWYARVSSEGNPADGPSRLKFEEASELFGSILITKTEDEWSDLCSRLIGQRQQK